MELEKIHVLPGEHIPLKQESIEKSSKILKNE